MLSDKHGTEAFFHQLLAGPSNGVDAGIEGGSQRRVDVQIHRARFAEKSVGKQRRLLQLRHFRTRHPKLHGIVSRFRRSLSGNPHAASREATLSVITCRWRNADKPFNINPYRSDDKT
jgi:hypothetical protein